MHPGEGPFHDESVVALEAVSHLEGYIVICRELGLRLLLNRWTAVRDHSSRDASPYGIFGVHRANFSGIA
jgi:hypothetical protein